jgi:hypothetical protein
MLSREVIFVRDGTDALAPLVMLHLWYHQIHCELFRIALPGYSESAGPETLADAPTGWLDKVRDDCRRHARSVAEVLALVNSNIKGSSFRILDPSLPMIVYNSLRLQLECISLTYPDVVSREREFELMGGDADVLLTLVQRMSGFFHPARLLVRVHVAGRACDWLVTDVPS